MLGQKPMIQHVYEQAVAVVPSRRSWSPPTMNGSSRRSSSSADSGLITGDYRSGTDRVAGVAGLRTGEFFLNLQGDEIPLDPDLLTDLIEPFIETGAEMGTLKRAIDSGEDLHNPAVVKVVTDRRPRPVFFTCTDSLGPGRSPPAGREGVALYSPGVYIYTRETLLRFAALPTGMLEDAEKLEQLRALEHGIAIQVWETTHDSLRIDTPEDAAAASETSRRLNWTSSFKHRVNYERMRITIIRSQRWDHDEQIHFCHGRCRVFAGERAWPPRRSAICSKAAD